MSPQHFRYHSAPEHGSGTVRDSDTGSAAALRALRPRRWMPMRRTPRPTEMQREHLHRLLTRRRLESLAALRRRDAEHLCQHCWEQTFQHDFPEWKPTENRMQMHARFQHEMSALAQQHSVEIETLRQRQRVEVDRERLMADRNTLHNNNLHPRAPMSDDHRIVVQMIKGYLRLIELTRGRRGKSDLVNDMFEYLSMHRDFLHRYRRFRRTIYNKLRELYLIENWQPALVYARLLM